MKRVFLTVSQLPQPSESSSVLRRFCWNPNAPFSCSCYRFANNKRRWRFSEFLFYIVEWQEYLHEQSFVLALSTTIYTIPRKEEAAEFTLMPFKKIKRETWWNPNHGEIKVPLKNSRINHMEPKILRSYCKDLLLTIILAIKQEWSVISRHKPP